MKAALPLPLLPTDSCLLGQMPELSAIQPRAQLAFLAQGSDPKASRLLLFKVHVGPRTSPLTAWL